MKNVWITAVILITAFSSGCMKKAPSQYQHIVCFKFKATATAADKEKHMAYFASLKDSVPGITGYSAGTTFPVQYEKTADYDCFHIVTFANEADIETYFHHPAHQRFIEANKNSWEGAFVVNGKED